MDSSFPYARDSAVPNLGADIEDAARHIQNRWRGLATAEQEGTAEQLLSRATLLEAEPLDLETGLTEENCLTTLILHLAVQGFPQRPYTSREAASMEGSKKKLCRQLYYSAYQDLRHLCLQLQPNPSPLEALAEVNRQVRDLIKQFQVEHGPYNAVANQLCTLANRAEIRDNPRQRDILSRFRAVEAHVARQDPAECKALVAQILAGRSLNQILGTVSKQEPWIVQPTDCYTKEVLREGGRSFDALTLSDANELLLNHMKFRGVQWGNTVPDTERVLHLRRLSEAFFDLGELLGIPAGQLTLGGKLALAVGARGHGKALAHYEPKQEVINLTRKKGIGALAHEWGHFLDHQLGCRLLRHRGRFYVSEYGLQIIPNDQARRFVTAFKSVAEANQQFSVRVRRGCKEVGMSSRERTYWASDVELFARAFEMHVRREFDRVQRRNTYLVGVEDHWLWPTEEESRCAEEPFREYITSAFELMGEEPGRDRG